MSANCQLICSLLTETTCSTLSLDLSALKDTCSSLSSRLEFICKLKGLNLPRFVLPYRDWAKYDYCSLHGTRISFNCRKHGFGDYILPKPCTLFHTFYILPFLSVPCIIYMGWDKGLWRSFTVTIFTTVLDLYPDTYTNPACVVHLIWSWIVGFPQFSPCN